MNENLKTLIVGDLHLKMSLILPRVEKIAEELSVDRIVFLGDYLDQWGADNGVYRHEMQFLLDWKEANKEKYELVFLCGNHDYAYIIYFPYCSGFNLSIWKESKEFYLNLGLQAAYAEGNYLFTHAGITEGFYKQFLAECETAQDAAKALNQMFEQEAEELNWVGFRRGGLAPDPGPFWADARELKESPCTSFNQIVGHTPKNSPEIYEVPNSESKLVFADTMSLRRDCSPIGDGSFLLKAGENLEIVNPEDFGFAPCSTATILDWMI